MRHFQGLLFEHWEQVSNPMFAPEQKESFCRAQFRIVPAVWNLSVYSICRGSLRETDTFQRIF